MPSRPSCPSQCRATGPCRSLPQPEHRGGRLRHEFLEREPPLGERSIEQRHARARKRSKTISSAGDSSDSRRMRLSAGCRRSCRSRTSRPGSAAHRLGQGHRRRRLQPASDLGEVALQRLRVPRLEMDLAVAQVARQRKPSYFGSYCQPGPDGRLSTASASMGGRSSQQGDGSRGHPFTGVSGDVSPKSSFSPRSTIRSEPSGSGRCSAFASVQGA